MGGPTYKYHPPGCSPWFELGFPMAHTRRIDAVSHAPHAPVGCVTARPSQGAGGGINWLGGAYVQISPPGCSPWFELGFPMAHTRRIGAMSHSPHAPAGAPGRIMGSIPGIKFDRRHSQASSQWVCALRFDRRGAHARIWISSLQAWWCSTAAPPHRRCAAGTNHWGRSPPLPRQTFPKDLPRATGRPPDFDSQNIRKSNLRLMVFGQSGF